MRWKIDRHACLRMTAWLLLALVLTGAELKQPPGEAIAKIREQCYAILRQAMKSEEAFIRSGAARAIGESGDSSLLPLMEKATQDFYPTTRQFALQGFPRLSREKTLQVARAGLADSNIWVKSTALDLLADLEDKESIPAILPLLEAPDRMVRLAAAYALVRLGDEEHLGEITGSVHGGNVVHRFQAITYLGKIPLKQARQLLRELLESNDEQVLSAALKAIGDQADMELFRPLVQLGLHSSSLVRRNAVLALGYLPPNAVTREVSPFCRDTDPLVQLAAALSMHRLGSTECNGLFEELLNHKDFAVRASTARVLGDVKISNRTALLAKALGDANSRVRTAAARAAGMMGGSEAFQLLIQMLDDPQEVIRAYAAGNLLRLMN